jgi:hypothetical protein
LREAIAVFIPTRHVSILFFHYLYQTSKAICLNFHLFSYFLRLTHATERIFFIFSSVLILLLFSTSHKTFAQKTRPAHESFGTTIPIRVGEKFSIDWRPILHQMPPEYVQNKEKLNFAKTGNFLDFHRNIDVFRV